MSAYSIATRGLAGRKIPQGVLAAINTLLFGASEPGAWYDPSDLSTLFQDSAGTTPVTAVEQPVGLMLDKSSRGNHASQATTTKRPIYSRRVNVFTKTERFADAVWGKNLITVTENSALAPDGTTSANLMVPGVSAVSRYIYRNSGIGGSSASVYVKSAGLQYVSFGNAAAATTLDFTSGTLNKTSGGGMAFSVAQLPDGWFKITCVNPLPTAYQTQCFAGVNASGGVIATDGVSGVYIWGASAVLAIDSHLPYQRVNTATDYDADPAKFPAYLRFDGVDDALSTGNIDFTGTDKMTVWAGVTKLSDTGLQMITELSTNAGVTSGSFWFLGGDNTTGAPGWGGRSGGTTRPLLVGSDIAAPIDSVLTLASDISGTVSSLRSNGALKATATSPHGTGSFASAPLFIGARAGTSLYFNGRLYSLIVRGAQSSLSQIEAVENLIRQKMRLP